MEVFRYVLKKLSTLESVKNPVINALIYPHLAKERKKLSTLVSNANGGGVARRNAKKKFVFQVRSLVTYRIIFRIFYFLIVYNLMC